MSSGNYTRSDDMRAQLLKTRLVWRRIGGPLATGENYLTGQ